MMIKVSLLIIFGLIHLSQSLETELLNKIRVLQFIKGQLTSGDRFGNNKQDQLKCVGDLNLCKNNTIDYVACHNSSNY